MLDLLRKKSNTQDVVTHSEMMKALKMIKKYIDKQTEVSVSEKLVKHIIDKATPSDAELKAIMKPLIPEPKHGKDGVDGKDGMDGKMINPVEIINKIKSHKGPDRLVVDNIRGMKKYIARINELSAGYAQIAEDRDEYAYQLGLLEKKINAIVVDIPVGGSGSCTCTDPAPSTCHFTDPSGDGVQGEQWFNESTNTLFTWLCGQWYSQVLTPFTPPQPEALLAEDDDTLLTEDDDMIVLE